MEQDKDLRQVLDETLDWLSGLPEDEIRRRLPEMRCPRGVDFRWTIGGTEYTVISHFNQNAGDDIFRKVQRLLDDEARGENNFEKAL